MLRTLTLAIVETMLRILSAFPTKAGRALSRWTARQRHVPVQAEAPGPICVAFAEPRPPRARRRKPPDSPVAEGGRAG